MKFKRTVFLAAVVIAMGVLLGAGAVQAATVIFDGTTTTAIGIEDLEVDGLFYNVTFPATTANALYGPEPNWSFPFTGVDDADEAVEAVIIALNNAGADAVGTAAPGDGLFWVGYGINQPETGITVTNGTYLQQWIGPGDPEWNDFDITAVYADFTSASEPEPEPEPSVTIGGNVRGLEGSGLVLQNNGLDDLPIDVDGGFTFATPLTPGESYDVTVSTQPEGQICIVQRGSGDTPDTDVTNVAVTCGGDPPAEPVVLRDCPGGAIVGGLYRAIVLTDYEDCVITDVVVTGTPGVWVKNPRLFSLLNSYVKGNVKVIRDNKSLEPSTATIINNLIDGGNIEIRELDEADVRRNGVYSGNIRVFDSESQPDQYAEVIRNRINGGNLRVNYNLSADVRVNSTEDGFIICHENLVLDSSGNEAVNGKVWCGDNQ